MTEFCRSIFISSHKTASYFKKPEETGARESAVRQGNDRRPGSFRGKAQGGCVFLQGTKNKGAVPCGTAPLFDRVIFDMELPARILGQGNTLILVKLDLVRTNRRQVYPRIIEEADGSRVLDRNNVPFGCIILDLYFFRVRVI